LGRDMHNVAFDQYERTPRAVTAIGDGFAPSAPPVPGWTVGIPHVCYFDETAPLERSMRGGRSEHTGRPS